MKRFLSFFLLFSLLLSGCAIFGERIKEPVTFYYVRSEYQYFSEDGVIASELREASGHRHDLSYLLKLYLMGPATDDLDSPLPRGAQIHKAEQTTEGIVLHLSNQDTSMSDAEFSLASACLALTCFDLTDAQNITIHSGERTVELDRNTLLLYDGNDAVLEETQ